MFERKLPAYAAARDEGAYAWRGTDAPRAMLRLPKREYAKFSQAAWMRHWRAFGAGRGAASRLRPLRPRFGAWAGASFPGVELVLCDFSKASGGAAPGLRYGRPWRRIVDLARTRSRRNPASGLASGISTKQVRAVQTHQKRIPARPGRVGRRRRRGVVRRAARAPLPAFSIGRGMRRVRGARLRAEHRVDVESGRRPRRALRAPAATTGPRRHDGRRLKSLRLRDAKPVWADSCGVREKASPSFRRCKRERK